MAKVVLIAEVEDAARWEAGYRSHGELLKSLGGSSSSFTTTGDNQVAIYTEVDDLDTFTQGMASEATAEAMAFDGVKPGTVKVFALDKEFYY